MERTRGNIQQHINQLSKQVYDSLKVQSPNKKDWLTALKDQDAVIHLAAETGTGHSMYEIQKYVDVNIGGTAILLGILTNKPYKVKKLLVASSRAIYGEGKYKCTNHGNVYPEARDKIAMDAGDFECKCPICNATLELSSTDEELKIHPISIYGITKQVQERMILIVGKSLNLPSVALRYQMFMDLDNL